MYNQFDDFDMMIQPEELQCDNPIEEDFGPRFDPDDEDEFEDDWGDEWDDEEESDFIRVDKDFLTD